METNMNALERVRCEREALLEKINALTEFLQNNPTHYQRNLLQKQLAVMVEYADILQERKDGWRL